MKVFEFKGDRSAGLTDYEARVLDSVRVSYPTSQEVADRAGKDRSGTHRALLRLEARGLVARIPAGKGAAMRWRVAG